MSKVIMLADRPSRVIRRDQASSSSTIASPTASTTTTNSFIGNTPSTVLFFIALAVGVCIALLFIYFTLRYFIKTKFGVYIPNHSFGARGGNLGGPMPRMGPTGRYAFAGGINTFNNFNDFADYALHRDYNALLAVRERRQQRRRYRKKRKLTKDEVDELFPSKTYYEWDNGGKESDLERQKGLILHENDLENENKEVEEGEAELNRQIEAKETEIVFSDGNSPETDITDLGSPSSKTMSQEETEKEKPSEEHEEEADITNAVIDDELHFSSGTCAICLDTLDNDDLVRGLICGHVFHQECIDPWLINRKACCPMCKRDYYMKDQNGEGAEENEDGADGESLMPLDSIADFILPRPIAFRARELLDALDAETNQAGANNTEGDNNTAQPESELNDNGNSNNENNDDNNNNNNTNTANLQLSGNINVQDLIGIRELALQKLPSYYNIFQRVFWKLMGITKQNLNDYLIVKIYEDRRRERLTRENELLQQRMNENNNNRSSTDGTGEEGIELQQRQQQQQADFNSRSIISHDQVHHDHDTQNFAVRRDYIEGMV